MSWRQSQKMNGQETSNDNKYICPQLSKITDMLRMRKVIKVGGHQYKNASVNGIQ